MDIKSKHNKELSRFWLPLPNFQSHSSREIENSVCGIRGGGGGLFSLKTLLLVSIVVPGCLFVLSSFVCSIFFALLLVFFLSFYVPYILHVFGRTGPNKQCRPR